MALVHAMARRICLPFPKVISQRCVFHDCAAADYVINRCLQSFLFIILLYTIYEFTFLNFF